MKPRTLDHVALNVSDPERTARDLVARLPFKILQRTDEFLLVGRSRRRGKLTLFAASEPRQQGLLEWIEIGIPCGTQRLRLDLGDGLHVELTPTDPGGHVDLHRIVLRVPDPDASARGWERLGFDRVVGSTQSCRVELAGAAVELRPGRPRSTDRPVLDHVGLRVSSIDDVYDAVAGWGLAVTREVDAENSRALFVRGPDGVSVEYIEHKPSFALA